MIYLATSDGSKDGLNFKRGGLCMDHNLRLKVVIRRPSSEKMDVDDETDAVKRTDFDDGSSVDEDGAFLI